MTAQPVATRVAYKVDGSSNFQGKLASCSSAPRLLQMDEEQLGGERSMEE